MSFARGQRPLERETNVAVVGWAGWRFGAAATRRWVPRGCERRRAQSSSRSTGHVLITDSAGIPASRAWASAYNE